ncbi:hypothetical protein RFI_06656 [Reticulomyxa filosa]|uniref:C2H2-type domain-containing protein n=1 Tax=Reticulomyxa filosa TaxID=46433 RepID=X6NX52_RETFI|nr:hypothetical protein RFI_06656 [Reticulomyxa filosa]|eukprot:ETO30463.1 hypothetical protein RFI_06656 [Reticulomyxa filosa]
MSLQVSNIILHLNAPHVTLSFIKAHVVLNRTKVPVLKKCRHCLLLFLSKEERWCHKLNECSHYLKKRNSAKGKYSCNLCDKTFRVRGSVTRHQQRVHKKEFSCLYPGCERKFGSRSDMMNHYPIHLKLSSVTVSERIALSFKKECEICHGLFVDSSALRKHIDTCHFGVKQFVCVCCSKKFARSINSKKKKQFPFILFDRKESLIMHYKTHVVDTHARKIFFCELCDSKFANKCNLRRHLKTLHQNTLRFLFLFCFGLLSAIYFNGFKKRFFTKQLKNVTSFTNNDTQITCCRCIKPSHMLINFHSKN